MPELNGRRAARVIRRLRTRTYVRVLQRISNTGWMAGVQKIGIGGGSCHDPNWLMQASALSQNGKKKHRDARKEKKANRMAGSSQQSASNPKRTESSKLRGKYRGSKKNRRIIHRTGVSNFGGSASMRGGDWSDEDDPDLQGMVNNVGTSPSGAKGSSKLTTLDVQADSDSSAAGEDVHASSSSSSSGGESQSEWELKLVDDHGVESFDEDLVDGQEGGIMGDGGRNMPALKRENSVVNELEAAVEKKMKQEAESRKRLRKERMRLRHSRQGDDDSTSSEWSDDLDFATLKDIFDEPVNGKTRRVRAVRSIPLLSQFCTWHWLFTFLLIEK